VVLSHQTDALGVRRLNIDLRFSAHDANSVIHAHYLLDDHLQRHQSGKLIYKINAYKEAVLAQASDGFHQIGTTRMSARAQDGVVDADCRVHGVKNLFVCSSSVFPTSGQANPTLTIMALAVRLAQHLHTHTLRGATA
jgi:choline dehydrogenase-like flavoprotein